MAASTRAGNWCGATTPRQEAGAARLECSGGHPAPTTAPRGCSPPVRWRSPTAGKSQCSSSTVRTPRSVGDGRRLNGARVCRAMARAHPEPRGERRGRRRMGRRGRFRHHGAAARRADALRHHRVGQRRTPSKCALTPSPRRQLRQLTCDGPLLQAEQSEFLGVTAPVLRVYNEAQAHIS